MQTLTVKRKSLFHFQSLDRVDKIISDLQKLELKIVLSNEMDKVDDSTDVLLVNSYGVVLKFYNITKYVFVGKSLSNVSKMNNE